MEELAKLYYNPTTGFVNLNILYELAQKHKINLSQKQIKKWYDDQQVNQIYKQPTVKPIYQSIIAVNYKPGTIQMDLLDINKFKAQNKGVKYLLVIIDVQSRYVWVFPIKNKKADTIEPFVRTVFEYFRGRKDYDQLYITCDNGKEFKGSVNKLFEEYDAKIYLNDPHALNAKRITAIAERMNRTIWTKLKKYMYANNTLNYIDA